jgi:transposase
MPKSGQVKRGSGSAAEVKAPPKKRRVFSPVEKLRIVREAAACGRGELEELLRREGIYSSHLATWRRSLETHGVEGMTVRRCGRKAKYDAKDHRIQELEKQLRAAHKELEVQQAMLELQKKVSRLLGIALPTSEKL